MAPAAMIRLARLSRHLIAPGPVAAIGAGGDVAELDDVAAVRKLMDEYSTGIWTADVPLVKSLYHESAAFNGCFGEKVALATPQTQYDQLEKEASSQTLKQRGIPQSYREVLSIVVYGQVATAVVQESIAEKTMTDVYHLMKLDGRWKIMSQLFVGSKRLAELQDVAAVRAVMDAYVQGTWTADSALLRSIFHERAVMNGYMGKRPILGTPQPFFDDMAKQASTGESFKAKGLPYRAEVVLVRVYGQTAEAVVQERGFAGALAFTDAFHLLKVDGEWKIMSKLFTGAKQS